MIVDIDDIADQVVFAVFVCLLSPLFGVCGSSISSVNIWLKVPNPCRDFMSTPRERQLQR